MEVKNHQAAPANRTADPRVATRPAPSSSRPARTRELSGSTGTGGAGGDGLSRTNSLSPANLTSKLPEASLKCSWCTRRHYSLSVVTWREREIHPSDWQCQPDDGPHGDTSASLPEDGRCPDIRRARGPSDPRLRQKAYQ